MATVSQSEYQNVQNSLNSRYTAESLNSYRNAVNDYKSQGMSAIDAAKKARSLLVEIGGGSTNNTNTTNTTNTTTPNTQTNTTYVAKPEYAGQGSTASRQPADTSWDTGNGQYTYNPQSGYYESQQPTNTQIGTTQTGVSGGDVGSRVRSAWDSLSYEEQQKRLSENPNLQANLTKYGATNKAAPQEAETTTGGTTGTTETPTQGGWDYQDNSPERMKQIADNVNGFAQSDPRIFNSEDSFRNFFIDGKGRTPEQEAFLMDLYKNSKQYNELDGYTADNIGYMYAHGQVPDSYLTYLKNSNPERYAEVMAAKDAETSKIKDDASMGTINSMEGDADMTTSNAIEWLKKQGLFVDKDGNLIDDRTENYASEEEQGYLKQIADLNAANLDIDNTVKHTYEDLVKAYPGATKATLMAMAQDINSDLLREKENNLVELTRLQGYVGYMQSERQERDAVGQNAINQLQKQYGMYYQYSPEGMSKLAQAQYAATNVTLDQADNGTDTQKQMALDSVLTPIYEQYGDIIQRPQAQVINDVIAYAKNNGVSLSQALEENFMKYLRQKPEYMMRVTGGANGYGEWKVIGEDELGNKIYGFVNSSTGVVVPYGDTTGYGTYGGGTTEGGLYGFTDYTPITTEEKETALNTFMSDHPLNSEGGQCGSFVNDYLQSLGYDRLYTDPIDKKKAITNSDTASVGSIAVMDSQKYPQYGHTAIVTDVQGDKVKLLESNWGDDKKVHERRVNKSDILGYFDPSKQLKGEQVAGKFDKGLELVYQDYMDANDKEKARIAASHGKSREQMDAEVKEYSGYRNAKDSKSLIDEIDKLLDGEIEIPPVNQRMDIAGEDFGWNFLTVGFSSQRNRNWLYSHNLIHDTLGMNKLVDLKSRGATFGALSDPEREAINNVATKLAPGMSEDVYKQTLRDIRQQLVDAAHGYLDDYHYEGGTVKNSANDLGLKKTRA